MPTIAEPVTSPIPSDWPPSQANLHDHLSAIVADLTDRGIRPRPLTVMSYALDAGVPEAIAVELAGMTNALAAGYPTDAGTSDGKSQAMRRPM